MDGGSSRENHPAKIMACQGTERDLSEDQQGVCRNRLQRFPGSLAIFLENFLMFFYFNLKTKILIFVMQIITVHYTHI